MDEITIYDINQLTEFKLFQSRSCNGMYTLLFDDDINEIINFLNEKKYKYYDFGISFKSARRINEDFFNEKIPLQDIYCLIEKYNLIVESSPLDLCVKMEDDFSSLGKVNFTKIDDMILFKNITLDTHLNSNLISFYAHELVHTQIEKNLYTLLENYFDREFISIFIELVISDFCYHEFSHNTFEKRLEILKHQFEFYKSNRSDNVVRSYLVSSFKALHLYNYYINSSSEIKKEILNDIERIFKEEITVGILLNKYEIDYDNSKKIKYLKK